MDIIHIAKRVLTEPRAFFKNVGKGKEQLGFAFRYFAVLLLVQTVLGILASMLFLSVLRPLLLESQLFALVYGSLVAGGTARIVANNIFAYVLLLGFSFLLAGLLHVWILLFGGKHSYVKTYELGVYAGTPAMLLGWIPLLGFVGQIWSLVLLIIGTQEVHGMARTKAILMYVIPVAVLFLLALLAMILLFLAFGSVFSAMLGGFPN